VSRRPIPTEFPFSFALIQAGQGVSHSGLKPWASPASKVTPISRPRPCSFGRNGQHSEIAWLPPLPVALDAVSPRRAPLLPIEPASAVPGQPGLALRLIPIEAESISRRPAMPCLTAALEGAPQPCLPAAAAVEFEHPVEERLVEPAVAGCTRPAHGPKLPRAVPLVAAPALECRGFQAPLQASAAAQAAVPRIGLQAALYEHGTALPEFRVETSIEGSSEAALLERIPPPGRTLLPSLQPQPAERWVAVCCTPEAILPAIPPVSLPAMQLEGVNPMPMVRGRAGWVSPLEPEPVEIAAYSRTELRQLVRPRPAASLPPAALPAAVAAAQICQLRGWQPMDAAEPVEMFLQTAMAQAQASMPALALPRFEAAGMVCGEMPLAAPAWEAVTAEPVESLPAVFEAAAIQWLRQPSVPVFAVKPAALPMAGFGASGPSALQPRPDEAFQPALEPAAVLTVAPPDSGLAPQSPSLSAGVPIPLEFFFHTPSGTLRKRISPIPAVPALMLPAWSLQAVAAERAAETREAQPAPRLDLAEVFKMPEARLRRARPLATDAFKALAASLLVGSLLWYGVPEIRQARHMVLLNHSGGAAGSMTADNGTGADGDEDSAQSESASKQVAASASPGLIGRIRGAVASRAATEITDNFHGGMKAWGAGAKTLAPGWSRSSGFVRPGQLALLHPSLGFADYKLEFLGQIENKSMDWVVRAADSKNYYAMKFTVIDPGPRPTIAIVHYPVVGGKAGRPVQIPLNVMVHNDTPYRVSVDVTGSHIVTSIEGEEVDSWTDTTLPKGGVGFFADAGERARLYWVKLAHNDDWIGRMCAYFTSDGSSASAELWPSPVPSPGHGRGTAGEEPVLAAGALAFGRRKRFLFIPAAESRQSGLYRVDQRRFPICHPS
jgi:hypothetical protein